MRLVPSQTQNASEDARLLNLVASQSIVLESASASNTAFKIYWQMIAYRLVLSTLLVLKLRTIRKILQL